MNKLEQKNYEKKVKNTFKRAGIRDDGYKSMEHFMEKVMEHLTEANNVYYDLANEKLCDKFLIKAIKVIKQARKYNVLVGL